MPLYDLSCNFFVADLKHVQDSPTKLCTKKVIHYQVSSLNRIKTAIKAKFCINFDYKMRKRMYNKSVLSIPCVT